jgi:hypothetical protein
MTVSVKAPTSTTGSIQLNGSDVLTIDSSGNLTAPNNLTVTGTVSSTGDVAFDTDTLYVDATNNLVGVGTNSPNDITGTGLRQLVVGNNSGNNGVIVNSSSSGDSAYSFAVNNVKLGRVSYDYLNNMMFQTNNAERMRIDSSGSLLAGKTGLDTTNAGLWINSNIANGYGRINFIKGTSSGTGATASCGFYYNGTSVGTIVNTSTATAFNTSSDYRLKENVSPMSGSIDRLKQLKPSTWSWKLDGSHGEGFLAHEAQTVVPEAITGTHNEVDDDDNPVYQGIDQSKLVPLLTAALQEAITKIEDLETRIQALENPNG